MNSKAYTATTKLDFKGRVEALELEVAAHVQRIARLEAQLHEARVQRDSWQELAERLLKLLSHQE